MIHIAAMAMAIATLAIGGTSAGWSQQAVTTATLSGTVEDQSGGRVVGAHVTLTHLDQNQVWRTHTDEQGAFRLPYLPVGRFQVRVDQPRFNSVVQEITLSVGQSVEMPVRLTVASASETVEVTGEAPVVESVRTQLSASIAPREVESLPLNGRNFLDLALLSPAVSRTNVGNNERFAETSAVPGSGISVAGKRSLNNSFILDGLSANDDAADLPGTFLSQEVIREFQVVTSGGIAEFGRASSGTVNILTHSGTNRWRGRLYGYLRNQRFDGVNVFASTDPATGRRRRDPLTQTQYGLTLGGPLRRDRIFLYSNFEQERLNRAGFVTISQANANLINAELARVGYRSARVETGEFPTGYDRTNYFLKSDVQLSDPHRLTMRYGLYDISSPNARGAGGLNAVSRGARLDDRDNNMAVNELWMISATTVNEARFQYTRNRLAAPGNDVVGPAINISGTANLGASTSSPTARDIDLIEVADNLSKQMGSHFIKAGVNLLYNRVNIVFPATMFGSYTFPSLASLLTGSYTTYQQAFGKIDWYQSNPNFGWFLQEEWRPRHDLTLNAGLRHDVQWLADPIETRWGNFGPRLGVAFAPGDHKLVIRTGFGLYYDRIPLRAVANGLRGDGTQYFAVSLQRAQAGAPAFPQKLASLPSGILLSLATNDPNIRNEYGLQGNLQVEREIAPATSASLGYLYTRGVHIIMQRNLNVPSCLAAQDSANLCRPNPAYANINQYSGQGDSYYHGMTLAVQHRRSTWAFGRLSYAFSKAIDNTGNFFFSSPHNQFDIRDDRGLSDNDQRHRLTLSGQIEVPRAPGAGKLRQALGGFNLSGIFTYGSPYPFNIVTGGQTIQTTAARPAGLGRNTGVGFAYASLDLRVGRNFVLTERFSLEAMAEAFNLLNRTNFQFPNNSTASADFGKPTAAADPRQLQIALRLNF